jgi:hypothetical protein
MSMDILEKMSVTDQAAYIFQHGDKKMIRKYFHISPSQYLMLNRTKKLQSFMQTKMEQMDERKKHQLFQEIVK